MLEVLDGGYMDDVQENRIMAVLKGLGDKIEDVAHELKSTKEALQNVANAASGFATVSKVMVFLQGISILVFGALLAVLILKDSNHELNVNRDGFHFGQNDNRSK